MWLLSFCLLLQSVFYADARFGFSYLESSRLCNPWTCVNNKLGLPLSLPPRDRYESVMRSLVSPEWHQALEKSLDACYDYRSRHRVYINTCPGQAILHCTVDKLMENCPENNLRKDDACYPVGTLAGVNYMFFQSRYKDMEKNLPMEHRPNWFMNQYFSTKCCDLPSIFNSSLLSECGFHSFLKYYDHDPETGSPQEHYSVTRKYSPRTDNSENTRYKGDETIEDFEENEGPIDPLDCCDMDGFISPSLRSECGFKLTWSSNRLNIEQNLVQTTAVPFVNVTEHFNRDVKLVPLSCQKETCVFKKLNVVSESGAVDREAFTRFLDNFTSAHQSWRRAKARVMTLCLNKNSQGYEADCEINKLLSCTFDVLTENCPSKVKNDVCRSSRRNHTVCQVSSSKYRPKNRRSICGLPSLVETETLAECGVSGINEMEFVPDTKKHTTLKKANFHPHSINSCQDSTPSTLCAMNKMGVLNKYNFLDYFKMKSRIRDFTKDHVEWNSHTPFLLNIFTEMPMYREYCSAPKKLLNVLDAMITMCPMPKRKKTGQCNLLFNKISNTPVLTNVTGQQLAPFLAPFLDLQEETQRLDTKKPLHDFGLLRSKDTPPVTTIEVKPRKDPLVLLPVYKRMQAELATQKNSISQSKDSMSNITEILEKS